MKCLVSWVTYEPVGEGRWDGKVGGGVEKNDASCLPWAQLRPGLEFFLYRPKNFLAAVAWQMPRHSGTPVRGSGRQQEQSTFLFLRLVAARRS